MKKEAAKKSALQPSPKVLVASRGKDGTEDALAVAYCGNCSFNPPMVMVGILPARFSHHLVKESGCFTVNIPTKDYQKTFDYLGSVSQRDEDKFKVAKVKTENAKTVNAPILSDCPISIECTVVDSIMTGSHEMFIGKIERVNADEELLDENGNVDYSKLDFI